MSLPRRKSGHRCSEERPEDPGRRRHLPVRERGLGRTHPAQPLTPSPALSLGGTQSCSLSPSPWGSETQQCQLPTESGRTSAEEGGEEMQERLWTPEMPDIFLPISEPSVTRRFLPLAASGQHPYWPARAQTFTTLGRLSPRMKQELPPVSCCPRPLQAPPPTLFTFSSGPPRPRGMTHGLSAPR